ncbi:PAS domain-containing sensor histidine kinase [Haloferax namakaokahaiae]|uniref:histidine kinase n=1 Tax=Haloferax namakaokahaiae TaxID=1748331 RepID=A0ABD5ZE12_9EURY
MSEWTRKEDGLGQVWEAIHQLFQGTETYALCLLDTDGNVVRWTEGAERILGYSAEDAIGQHVTEFYPDEASQIESALSHAETRGSYEHVGWFSRDDQSRLWVQATFNSLYDDEDTLCGFAKIVRDNTETRAYQEQLERSRDRLARTEALADVAGWEYDTETERVHLTEGSRKLLAASSTDSVRLSEFLDLFSSEARDALESAVRSSKRSGETFDLELRVGSTTNTAQWVQVRGNVTDDGELIRGAIRDVSARKEREQRLMVLNRVLRHNLRNTLNIVTGYAASLRSDITALEIPEESEGREPELTAILENISHVTEEMDAELETLQKTIEAVSEFSSEEAVQKTDRIVEHSEELMSTSEKARKFEQAVKSEERSSTTRLQSVFDEVERRYTGQYPEASIDVGETDVKVSGNTTSLRLAVGELVTNALEHNDHDQPAVSLTTESDDSTEVRILVEDNGPGIPDDERTILQRGEETALVHGEGLGLWTVNWIVTQLGGEVSINDNESRGTTVVLTLPTVGTEETT